MLLSHNLLVNSILFTIWIMQETRKRRMSPSMIAVTAFKPSRSSHIGINLWESPVVVTTASGAPYQPQRHLIVVYIDDHSIFSQSNLKVGMKIDYVNDISVSRRNYSVADVYRLLQDALGWVTILASAPGLPKTMDTPPTTSRKSTSTASLTAADSPVPAMNEIDSSSSDDDDDDDDELDHNLDRQIRSLWLPLL